MKHGGPVRQRGNALGHGRAFSVLACWQWMIAISQVAVEHYYAAPWEHDSDPSQASKRKQEGKEWRGS
jgi:hypothetical protein